MAIQEAYGFIMGNAGKPAELRYTPSGKAVASFSVACNRRKPDSSAPDGWATTTDWYEVQAWGQQAELINGKFPKGAEIVARGRLEIDQWKGQDGSTRTTVRCVADNIRWFVKNGNGAGTGGEVNPDPHQVEDVIPF